MSRAGETSSLASLPVNSVYGWGHGNQSIMRVVFPIEATGNGSGHAPANVHPRSICINPTAIACAKYHNVAITADGRVYTWGLHSESLGVENATVGPRNIGSEWATASEGRRPRSNSISSSTVAVSAASSPQLVVGMLPENGGGKAVAVSASESHTAVVTSDGHLFTWGTSVGNNILGHKGVKWQPSPRKVQRVHRAVGVAAAKEHTVLLMATTFPSLPSLRRDLSHVSQHGNNPLTLQECSAIEISRNVDLFNVVPIALIAQRLDSRPLIDFCDEFIRKNLDGVLAVGTKSDFASFLSSGMTAFAGRIRIRYERDGVFHPFLYDLANSKTWVDDSHALLRDYAIISQRNKVKRRSRREKHSCSARQVGAQDFPGNKTQLVIQTVAETEVALIAKDAGPSSVAEESNHDYLQVKRKLFVEKAPDNCPKFHCEVCNVFCPDCDSYTLHMNGRKHRNRLTHARAKEEKQVAESMMEMKRMMLMWKTSEKDDIGKTFSHERDTMNCETSTEVKKLRSAWTKNTAICERKGRSKSFQEILNEEQQKSSNPTKNSNGSSSTAAATIRPLGFTQTIASVAFDPTKIPTTVAHAIKPTPPSSLPGGQFFPLSAFMKKGSERNRVETSGSAGASWGPRQAVAKDGNGWGLSSVNKGTVGSQHAKKSFSLIQQEEEAIRSNEDHMCHIRGNHWFVQQRERAASIGEIQEQEEKDREMQALIEEQRQIENDILMKSKQRRSDAKRNRKKQGKHLKYPTTNT